MILEILMDDSDENVVYDLHRHDRRNLGHIACGGVFKKYESLKKEMADQIEYLAEWAEFDEFEDEEGEPDSEYCWFVINKYCLENGEYQAINYALVQRNWLIGYRIAEEELKGENRAEYGTGIIKRLSKELSDIYGKGFTKTFLRFSTQRVENPYRCFLGHIIEHYCK